MTGRSSELEAREGGDGEHVGALEAMIGEAEADGTTEGPDTEDTDEIGVAMMRFDVLFVVVTILLVAVAIGMTRVMFGLF